MKGNRVVAPAALALLATTAAPGPAQETPWLSGYVMDEAGLLSTEVEARLDERLQAYAAEAGSQVVVLTVPTLGGQPIEDLALERAEAWGLGRADRDDGVLLVIAQAERRMRIEVGYGLEGALTDAASRRILDNIIAPRFREGDFDAGIEQGVERILATIEGEVPPPEQEAPPERGPGSFVPAFIQFVILLLIFMVVLRALQRRSRRGRGWSSRNGWRPRYPPVILPLPMGRTERRGGTRGSRGPRIRLPKGGGGFGGFRGGGGGFGGGGASGSW